VAAKANAETTLKNEVSAEKPMTAAEQEEHIDFLLYGYPRSRYRIGTMLSQGDTSLLCGFQTEFRTDLQSAFGDVISRDSRDEPKREAIESALLRHFDGKSSRALSLYEASLNADREKGIRLMDELLELPKEERMPLEALAKYRRARLKMSLEDWAGLSDDDDAGATTLHPRRLRRRSATGTRWLARSGQGQRERRLLDRLYSLDDPAFAASHRPGRSRLRRSGRDLSPDAAPRRSERRQLVPAPARQALQRKQPATRARQREPAQAL